MVVCSKGFSVHAETGRGISGSVALCWCVYVSPCSLRWQDTSDYTSVGMKAVMKAFRISANSALMLLGKTTSQLCPPILKPPSPSSNKGQKLSTCSNDRRGGGGCSGRWRHSMGGGGGCKIVELESVGTHFVRCNELRTDRKHVNTTHNPPPIAVTSIRSLPCDRMKVGEGLQYFRSTIMKPTPHIVNT